MNGLSFLNNISLAANSAVKPTVTKAVVGRNPEKADIRIYKSGNVFPSLALVKEFDLAFVGKTVTEKGNGFDVFTSKDFLNTQQLEAKFIIISCIGRANPKVDLFGSCTYDANGEPKVKVEDQGANTFGVQLLIMIKEMYGVEIGTDEKYMDLIIAREQPLPTTTDNVYWIPKKVSKGDKKGQLEMIKRENLQLYALVPRVLVDGTEAEKFTDEEIEKDKLANAPTREEEEEVTEIVANLAAGSGTLADLETSDEDELLPVAEIPQSFGVEEEEEATDEEGEVITDSPNFLED